MPKTLWQSLSTFKPFKPRPSRIVRPWLLGPLALLVVAGCSRSSLQPVRIDFAKVSLQFAPNPPIPASESLKIPAPTNIPAASQTIVGDPPMIAEKNAIRDTATIGKAINEELNATSKDVFSRFKSILLRRLQDKQFAKQQAFDQQKLESYQNASARISALYKAYAAKRFPLLVQLSSIVGFPDPDPKSERHPGNGFTPRDRFHSTAVKLRAQIKTLDDQFQHQMSAILGTLHTQSRSIQIALDTAYNNDLASLNDLAKAAAKRVTGQSRAEIKPELVDQGSQIIPGVAANTLSLPASQQVQIQVAPPLSPAAGWNKAALQVALKTWLALNGYRLSKDSNDPDKTAQFVQWINQYRPETSSSPSAKSPK